MSSHTTTGTIRLVSGAPAALFALTLTLMLAAAAPAHGSSVRASVVGGSDAAIEEVPHQAALVDARAPSPYDGQYCGAVVLDATHVATAAHCLVLDGPEPQLKPIADIRVLAGTATLLKPGEPSEAGEREVAVSARLLHPAYSASTQDADIAVLTTATPLFSGTPAMDADAPIAPIEMQSEAQAAAAVDAHAAATLSGWGFTGSAAAGAPRPDASAYPQRLQRAVLHFVPDAACAESFEGLSAITPRMLCAGGGSEPAACYGDSGGPLTADDSGSVVLAGIVSFGSGCAQPRYPDVFTRVGSPSITAFLRDAIASTGGGASEVDPPSGDADSEVPVIPPPPVAQPPESPPAPPPTVAPPTVAPSVVAPPAASPPAADGMPPTQHLIRKRCGAIRCLFNVQVSDPLPSSGIRELYVRQRWVSTRPCRRRGRASRCKLRVAHTVPARSLGAGRFLVRTRRLSRRPSVLNLTGIDRAGNPARRSAMIVLSSRRRIRHAMRRARARDRARSERRQASSESRRRSANH